MNHGFWETLKRPFFVLAPLADVTDAAFRRIVAKYGKPDVMYTEFVSADGIFLADEEGKDMLMEDLVFSEKERPIVAQFFTSRVDMIERAAALASERGFDGVDINMGCPDKSIEKQGAGAALMKNPTLSVELIKAAKKGAPTLPVSVKTRIGYNKNEIEDWLPALLSAEPSVITMHARTRKEMSDVPARWAHIKRAVEIRDELKSRTLIIGNGDVVSLNNARERVKQTKCDGVMLGRAIFSTPWLFSNSQEFENRLDSAVELKILKIIVEHTKLFEELLPHKNFATMKKHYKAYVSGFDGAKELRVKLMECGNATEVGKIIEEYIKIK